VREIPCELEPFKNDPGENYDLVILAYQVWYLSPSIPITSFLKSDESKKILKGKPVVTVLGVRNMWIKAYERVSAMISQAGGRHVGNIVMEDPAGNLTSVITIVRWMMKGEKESFRWMGKNFPAAGVPGQDILRGSKFGEILKPHLAKEDYTGLQQSLVAAGAVKVHPVLFKIESTGKRIFGIWSKLILKKGSYGEPAREGRLKAFQYYLFAVIYLVSPIVAGIHSVIFFLNPGAARKIVSKYSGL
jgi:hypothetical protein